MTTYFNYEEMTWDAIAGLPRDTPLVLPLGSGYNLDLLASQLSSLRESDSCRHSRLAGVAADWRSRSCCFFNTFQIYWIVCGMTASLASIAWLLQAWIRNRSSSNRCLPHA